MILFYENIDNLIKLILETTYEKEILIIPTYFYMIIYKFITRNIFSIRTKYVSTTLRIISVKTILFSPSLLRKNI